MKHWMSHFKVFKKISICQFLCFHISADESEVNVEYGQSPGGDALTDVNVSNSETKLAEVQI